jgi:hypothetical protein
VAFVLLASRISVGLLGGFSSARQERGHIGRIDSQHPRHQKASRPVVRNENGITNPLITKNNRTPNCPRSITPASHPNAAGIATMSAVSGAKLP